ncbi:unnamed protein product [Prunus armeniaca]
MKTLSCSIQMCPMLKVSRSTLWMQEQMADEAAVEEDDTKDGAADEVGVDVKELAAGAIEQMAAVEQTGAVVGAVDQEATEEVVGQGSPAGVL